jgi:hypothetical protein
MKVSVPPEGFGLGVSFYTGFWPLLATPLKSFQIGLPGTWIVPDNRGYEQPLCPQGTFARDNWPERAPSYRDVFQTIEGGMSFSLAWRLNLWARLLDAEHAHSLLKKLFSEAMFPNLFSRDGKALQVDGNLGG